MGRADCAGGAHPLVDAGNRRVRNAHNHRVPHTPIDTAGLWHTISIVFDTSLGEASA